MRGFSEANGSWKMIWMSRRACTSDWPERSNRFWPLSSACPSNVALPRSNCTIALPVVVLPQPDSPTSASVSRSATLNDTPSTALKKRVPR